MPQISRYRLGYGILTRERPGISRRGTWASVNDHAVGHGKESEARDRRNIDTVLAQKDDRRRNRERKWLQAGL